MWKQNISDTEYGYNMHQFFLYFFLNAIIIHSLSLTDKNMAISKNIILPFWFLTYHPLLFRQHHYFCYDTHVDNSCSHLIESCQKWHQRLLQEQKKTCWVIAIFGNFVLNAQNSNNTFKFRCKYQNIFFTLIRRRE